MRRVAMLALTIGLTLTGTAGSAAARPAAAGTGRVLTGTGEAGSGAARWLGPAPAKTVSYDGLVLTVPASWPVYRLSRDSRVCVRYDRHAVYLGQPGSDQLCPAHLAGRVDTVSIQPAAAGPGHAPGTWRAAPAARALQGGPQQAGRLMMDTQDHQLLATATRAGLAISATYASSSALVGRIIASVRPAAGQPAASRAGQSAAGEPGQSQPGQSQPAAGLPAAGQPAAGQPAAAPAGSGWPGGRHRWLGMRRGFDTCSAPSLRTMSRWRSTFSAMAIYIGGPEAACGWGNLSPGWVRAVTRMGWALIPTYVGRQATCSKMFRVRIQLRHAYAEGRAAAEQAMSLAAALGLGPHAPLYEDMEYYHHQWGRCRRGVLSFLNGWTRALHASGHRSGVYSSASAAVVDLARTSTVYGRPLAKPDSVWFGLWDRRPTLAGMPYLEPFMWPAGHRIKQWLGAHRRRIGGVTLDIDSDLVAGAVYRLTALPLAAALLLAAGLAVTWPGCRRHPAKLGGTRTPLTGPAHPVTRRPPAGWSPSWHVAVSASTRWSASASAAASSTRRVRSTAGSARPGTTARWAWS